MSAVDYLCTAIAFNDQADPAAPPVDRIAAWKRVGDNSLYFRTAAGIERCVTQTTGPSAVASYSQLIIDGTDVAALLVERQNEQPLLICDTQNMRVECYADTTVTGDLTLGGQITAVDSQVQDIENAMISLSTDQTTTDTSNQGWYASYVPVGGSQEYRGLLYYTDIGRFAYSDAQATEPTGVSAANTQGIASFGTLQMAAISNQLQIGPDGGSITVNQNIPVGGQLTYTIPNVEQAAQFVMLDGISTINGTKTAAQVTTAGPIYGTAYDYQLLYLGGYVNATNLNVARVTALDGRLTNVPTNIPAISVHTRFDGALTPGIIEYGIQQVRLRQGTYRMIFFYRAQANQGICEMYCTALSLSIMIDGYSASVTIAGSSTDFAVPAAGVYDFAFRQNGKNPASSGYIFDFWPYVELVQIA